MKIERDFEDNKMVKEITGKECDWRRNNLQNIIKQILSIIGDYEGSKLTINIYPPDDISFYIYDIEIPINIDIKTKYAYIDCELIDGRLTKDMLSELSEIVKIIEDNINNFT